MVPSEIEQITHPHKQNDWKGTSQNERVDHIISLENFVKISPIKSYMGRSASLAGLTGAADLEFTHHMEDKQKHSS